MEYSFWKFLFGKNFLQSGKYLAIWAMKYSFSEFLILAFWKSLSNMGYEIYHFKDCFSLYFLTIWKLFSNMGYGYTYHFNISFSWYFLAIWKLFSNMGYEILNFKVSFWYEFLTIWRLLSNMGYEWLNFKVSFWYDILTRSPPVNCVIKSMKEHNQKWNPMALVRWNTDVKPFSCTIWDMTLH